MRAVGGADCVLPIVADISDPDAVAQAVRRTITELGGLHILVNNAGTNPRAAGFEAAGQRPSGNFWDITPAAWHRVVAVNFTGAFLMAREVAGHMLAQGCGAHYRGDDQYGYDVSQRRRTLRPVQGRP